MKCSDPRGPAPSARPRENRNWPARRRASTLQASAAFIRAGAGRVNDGDAGQWKEKPVTAHVLNRSRGGLASAPGSTPIYRALAQLTAGRTGPSAPAGGCDELGGGLYLFYAQRVAQGCGRDVLFRNERQRADLSRQQ